MAAEMLSKITLVAEPQPLRDRDDRFVARPQGLTGRPDSALHPVGPRAWDRLPPCAAVPAAPHGHGHRNARCRRRCELCLRVRHGLGPSRLGAVAWRPCRKGRRSLLRHARPTVEGVAAVRELAERYGLRLAALTRGAAGSLLVADGVVSARPAEARTIVDTVGAGDAFTAAVVMGLLGGRPLDVMHDHAARLLAIKHSVPGRRL